MFFQKLDGLHPGSRPHTRRGDHLAIMSIRQFAGRVHPWDTGLHQPVDHQVALIIHLQLALEKFRIGGVTDEYKDAFSREVAFFTRLNILQA